MLVKIRIYFSKLIKDGNILIKKLIKNQNFPYLENLNNVIKSCLIK